MRHETMKTLGVAALAAAILIGSVAPATGQRSDPAQLLAEGQREFEAGDYEAARRDLWAYLEATASLSGPSRLPQAEALYTIALMEPDAGVAAQHYKTVVDEYPASSVADEALFRLAQLDLVEGRTEEARERLRRLSVDYPFSRYQAEVPLWTGKAWLADRQYRQATDLFIEGFTRVKRQDLPQELSPAQREALGAEYIYQLARAFAEEGDQRTATQYNAMLALDYPDSPQAAEARLALDAGGAPAAEPVQVAEAPREEPAVSPEVEEPVDVPDADVEPAVEPAAEAPDVVIEDVEPREETPREETPREEPAMEEPPPVVIEDVEPREEPSGSTWLQVGAFTSATNAADLSRRLKADGFDSKVQIEIVDGQGYYRVRVGPYRLPSESSRLGETRRRLDARGYPTRQMSE
jgi:cell division protein FtsN